MFLGSSEHTLDEKLRLVLPKKDREVFGSKAVVAWDYDGNLALFTLTGFQSRARQIESLSDFDQSARALKRTFFGKSLELDIDSHGRVNLPKYLLDKAGIVKEVTLVGVVDRIELWDSAKYEAVSKAEEKDYPCLAQKMLTGTPDAK